LALSLVYLDASILVPLFKDDRFTSRAEAFLQNSRSTLLVSDFAAAEFASAVARHVRMRSLAHKDALVAFSSFDNWVAQVTQRVETTAADVAAADAFIRRLDLPLRAPDAINIAIAQRLDAAIATFDDEMAACARALGTAVTAA
jgi:predicted nucleic acid-binding protein